MRSNEIFARMRPEVAEGFLGELAQADPATAGVILNAIAGAFKLRPKFLRRQPRSRQAEWMRKVLARPGSCEAAEEILASYFLGQHLELLTELLEGLGIEHEEGRLQDENPDCPDPRSLEKTVDAYLEGAHPERRRLLLEAFAAQNAIDWPDLERLLTREA